ncbi:MAG: hypothetical protein ABEJ03_01880 [Candidatus Nanohaloarchaea archaeon]
MPLEDIVFAINASGTLTIGSICFFLVYTSFRGIEDEVIQEFSKRFMMAISLLLLYVSYLMVQRTMFSGVRFMESLRYFILAMVFVYIIYSTLAFEEVASKYGISREDKLDKMEREEGR